MIKLCYKEYSWKISNNACRSFKEKTGRDLMGFFAAYIVESINLPKGVSVIERCELFRSVHLVLNEDGSVAVDPFDLAAKAIHCIICDAEDGVSLDELRDGMERVSWILSDRPDDLSEPWPIVMLDIALQINEYMSSNLPAKKKADI